MVKDEKGSQKKGVKKQGIETRSLILELIKSNPHITRKELEEKLKMSSSAIQKHIKILKEQGRIIREGDVRRGIWKVIE